MKKLTKQLFKNALYGRFIGCIFGAIVENFPQEEMVRLAKIGGDDYPITNYWNYVKDPDEIRYGVSKRINFQRDHIHQIEVDDDITYTYLALLILERYGLNFTSKDVAEIWLDILPYACTAEDTVLTNLKKGIPFDQCRTNKEQVELIGAQIRGDMFGYVNPNNPLNAIKMSRGDSELTHEENGVYGTDLIAAAIAIAFNNDDPFDSLVKAIEYLPHDSELYKQLHISLERLDTIHDYNDARRDIDARFPGMDCVHIINNSCAILYALYLGGKDYVKIIGNAIAIGLDNDCTGATVGSIACIALGENSVPSYLTDPLGDVCLTYLKGHEKVSMDDFATRVYNIAKNNIK